MSEQVLTLSALNNRIKSSMLEAFPHFLWVSGEISEIKVNSSGHCYMELIEKDNQSDCIIARQRAVIWAYTYRMVAPYFQSMTGSNLVTGMKILVNVKVEYHEVYGISLVIRDIDPKYTIGDLAQRKKEILKKLKELGIIDMNRMMPLPIVAQRIAVISSETAAGYGDFTRSILENPYGYNFRMTLFPSLMQGDKAELSIINALEKIYKEEDKYDAVVIIRGGGASADLECFNNYDLVYHIAQFPLPVITGIGHERDETIADIVAHTSLKTPTAVAEFIINLALQFDTRLEDFKYRLAGNVRERITAEKHKVGGLLKELAYRIKGMITSGDQLVRNFSARLVPASRQYTARKKESLDHLGKMLEFHTRHVTKQYSFLIDQFSAGLKKNTLLFLNSEKEYIASREKNTSYLDPVNVLRRGYSITSLNGKAVKDSSELNNGDTVITRYGKGGSTATITGLIKDED